MHGKHAKGRGGALQQNSWMYIIIVFRFTGRTNRVSVVLCFQRIVLMYRVHNNVWRAINIIILAKTTMPCSHCNISLVCSLCPGAFTTLRAGRIEFNSQFAILKNFILIPFPENNTYFSLQIFTVRHILQKLENTIIDKNVKKNAQCMSNFRILPSKAGFIQDTSPSPQKQQRWTVAETFLLTTKQHWPGKGGGGGGVTTVPNSCGGSAVSKKVQNS